MSMKRYIYILVAATSFFMWGCGIENIDTPPTYEEVGVLDVSFVYNGTATKTIMLPSAAQTIEVEVKLNIEGVNWNVVSDQPWCVVDEEVNHQGNGSFEIAIEKNKALDDREPATVSLCAGEYKSSLTVTQDGNIFIMDNMFALGMKKAGSTEVSLNVKEGAVWSTKQPEWIKVSVEEVASDGATESKMTLNWEENTSESRLGVVELYKDGDALPSAQYALWQFGDGSDYGFDGEGNLRLVANPNPESPLVIKTPSNQIETLLCPDWVRLEKVENDDMTTTWSLYFNDNPSDCYTDRETLLAYAIAGTTQEFPLPVIYQDSYPMGGIVSLTGFAMFVEKYNEGGKDAVGDWMTDGAVTLCSSIDLSDFKGSLGTETRPFDLKFNGSNYTISGFTGSSPLFGICDGAEIYDLVMDETCKVSLATDYTLEVYLASLAGKITNTTIRNCTTSADVELGGRAVSSGFKVYAGGLVAYADPQSSITGCQNKSTLYVSVEPIGTGGEAFMGGLVGKSSGIMNELVNSGSVQIRTNIETMHIGGVVGCVEDGSFQNSYSTSGASIIYDVPEETENELANLGKNVYVGGVAGSLNIPLEQDCSQMPVKCNITCCGMAKGGDLLVGGMIGRARKDLTLNSPKWNGSINFNMAKNQTVETNNACFGGVLGLAESVNTLVEGAETSGTLKVFAARDTYWKVPTAIGGVVGCASNGCTISNSINNASLAWDATSKKSSAGGVVSSGGIIGRIDKGLAVISGCTNNGAIHNIVYHEAKWESGKLLGARTGGVIGTYGYVKNSNKYDMKVSAFEPADSNNVIITNCHSTSEVLAFRGLVGGIAGYLYNAKVTDCSNTGVSSNKRNNCNVGGIAGAVENTTIDNCMVKASLYGVAQGLCEFKAGGIAAYLYTNSTISNCNFWGHITTGDNAGKTAYYGGIVGEAQEGCSVVGCSYGGSIPDADDYKQSVTITEQNYDKYIIGNGSIEPQGCSYWSGE